MYNTDTVKIFCVFKRKGEKMSIKKQAEKMRKFATEIAVAIIEVAKSINRVRKKDPVTFWCSIWAIFTGTASICLKLTQLFL